MIYDDFDVIYKRFCKEIADKTQLVSVKDRALITIVSLVVQNSQKLLLKEVEELLKTKVLTDVEITEAIYQTLPYVGFSRGYDALILVSNLFNDLGIRDSSHIKACTDEDRFRMGLDAQATIFGNGMRDKAEDPNATPVTLHLVNNCFGDYYTREGLNLETREMLTLAILINHGTEPQIKAHMVGNLNMGRSREYIDEVIRTCLPYCGYPRTLNAQNVLASLV